MWFADLGLALSWAVLVAVLAAPVLTRLAGSRPGWTPATRRTLWLAGLGSAALWVAQAVVVDRVEDVGGPTTADRAALVWFIAHREAWLDGLGRVLALIGGPGAMTVLAVIGVGALWARGRWADAAVVAATGAGAVLLGNGFKNLYERQRPPPDAQVMGYTNYALPSGHALGSIVVVGVLTAVLVLLPWRPAARVAVLTAAVVFVVAVGASRVYLAAHWLTDVLAGWLLGGAWLTLGATALVLLRRAGGQPVSPRTSQVVTPPRS